MSMALCLRMKLGRAGGNRSSGPGGVDLTQRLVAAGRISPWSWFVKGTSGYLTAVKEFDHGFGEITRDLEALKLALIEMTVDGLPATEANAMAQEISAIRLHLKRLEYDRKAVSERAHTAWHGDGGRTALDDVGEVGAT